MQVSVKEDRNKYIGGSDIPIIMGISPFKSRFDLLLEKAGIKNNDFDGNEYTEYGNVLEPKIRDFINKGINDNFVEGKLVVEDIRCHTDGINATTVLEIKTTSQIHDNVDDYVVYLVQLLFYMEYNKKNLGILAVYNRPDDFNEEFDATRLIQYNIKIEDYKYLLDKINEAVEQFRIDLEKVKQNPFITEEELMPTDLIKLSTEVVELENQLTQYKLLEAKQKDLKEQLKKAMVDHGIKKWETPNGIKITLVPDGEDKEALKFNEKKFKEENEKVYNKYLESKIVKGKSGYVLITMPKKESEI